MPAFEGSNYPRLTGYSCSKSFLRLLYILELYREEEMCIILLPGRPFPFKCFKQAQGITREHQNYRRCIMYSHFLFGSLGAWLTEIIIQAVGQEGRDLGFFWLLWNSGLKMSIQQKEPLKSKLHSGKWELIYTTSQSISQVKECLCLKHLLRLSSSRFDIPCITCIIPVLIWRLVIPSAKMQRAWSSNMSLLLQ